MMCCQMFGNSSKALGNNLTCMPKGTSKAAFGTCSASFLTLIAPMEIFNGSPLKGTILLPSGVLTEAWIAILHTFDTRVKQGVKAFCSLISFTLKLDFPPPIWEHVNG